MTTPETPKADPQEPQGAKQGTKLQTSKKVAATREDAAPEFPRQMQIVNDTAMPYVIARVYVEPGKAAPVTVRDADEKARIEVDCEHLLELNGSYEDREVPALRLVDADDTEQQ
ncbi:hypothetical protein [Paraburkholderia sp. J10-1]|uniref:hypothetical protein n=1 Tax=Paraburkholderia sp. J10-1 TaxID=2805430 RepID=UPI002AB77226|nr:hypothetical protein [Paraburkholderia sp. J10-1]